MSLFTLALLAQLGATTLPVLTFPESGLDDSAAYQGYQTRFFRDAARNTVQIYLDQRQGRVVHLLADAENESIGFTASDARGRPTPLRWASAGVVASSAGRTRTLEYSLEADAPEVLLGLFLLGSMRVERDFQASGEHRSRLNRAAFELPEIARLIATIEHLDQATRQRHLTLLGARDLGTLRARTRPTLTTRQSATIWVARVIQPSLDGHDTLSLEVHTDPRRVAAVQAGTAISLRARSGHAVTFAVRISTSGAPLAPLERNEIFSPSFLDFAAGVAAAGNTGAGPAASPRARWMERQVRGVELLASREKLMAGLPTYATYFGRDMMVSALMMRPIWRDEMSEFVIASVLRKLSPTGHVSHEEALGGQAVREAAAEYAALVDASRGAARRGDHVAADTLLARAGTVLRDHRLVRENYHMMDGEFQLPILIARWIGDPAVPAQRKRAFLLDSSDHGEPRLTRMLRELAFVSRATSSYATNSIAANLVSFAPRDSAHWSSASWRDSNAGYGGGRYAMDINAIWVPHALESIEQILTGVRALGFSTDSLARAQPDLLAEQTPLGRYVRDASALRHAMDAWRGASQHFLVRFGPAEVQSHVTARLAAMPAAERDYWTRLLAATGTDRDSLTFLAVALDANARPIGIANTDPATRLFLGDGERTRGAPDAASMDAVLRDVRLFVRPYPVGLFIEQVGPVVANDAYAEPSVWHDFERDPYHGSRVAWGREVNLFLLGVSNRVAATWDRPAAAPQDPAVSAYVADLRRAAERVASAVEASGFHSELWSYTFAGGRPTPVRYGAGADVQLWSTTDLAVQFALAQLAR